MTRGREIEMFLVNGDPSGLVTCSLSNWSGKAYRFAKSDLSELDKREELSRRGKEVAAVYILFGEGDDHSPVAYIGETDEIRKRLKIHRKDERKEFWTETIFFTDDDLNKAHVKYLESRLIDVAVQAERYQLQQEKASSPPNLSESDTAKMESFIDNIKLLADALGHKIFEPYIRRSKPVEIADSSPTTDEQLQERLFYIKQKGKGIVARGTPTREGFVVLKDSQAVKELSVSCTDAPRKSHRDLIDQGILAPQGDQLVFTKDWLFKSPSGGACVVMGRNANGWDEWRLEDGTTTLRDAENAQ